MPFVVTCYITGATYTQKRFSINYEKFGIFSVHAENSKPIAIIKDGIPYDSFGENCFEPRLYDGLNTLWAVLTKIGIVSSIPFLSFFQGMDITNKIFMVSFEQGDETVSVNAFLDQLRKLDISTTACNIGVEYNMGIKKIA